MTVTLSDLRAALGGHVSAGQLVCPGPGHSRRDRSMAVRPSDTTPIGFVVTSFSGDDWRDCRDYVCERLGIDPDDVVQQFDPIARMQARARRIEAEKEEAADRERRIRRAVALWEEAIDPTGTVVEIYLEKRGLDLLPDIAGTVIRFHPACPWGEGSRRPAMLAAMRSVISRNLTAIHRTALTGAG